MCFVKIPYLPEKRITLAIGDLQLEAVRVIKPYRLDVMPLSMQRHADLSFCYLGDGVAVCAPEAYSYYKTELDGTGIELIKGGIGLKGNYPFDAAYNVGIVGDKIYCKKAITDIVLLSVAESMGYDIININQGYAKCSICPVDRHSAISADMSFYKAAVKEGMDVLLITNEAIGLEGFANGFFGGCAFKYDKDGLFVNGDVRQLPQYENIRKFLEKREIKLVYDSGQVTDFGSLIPIMEE